MIFILLIWVLYVQNTKSKIEENNLVYVVLKSKVENYEFWGLISQGALEASKEFNLELKIEGPKYESNIDEQIRLLKNIMKENPKAIILAASDKEKLREVINEIVNKGIILIFIDSKVETNLEIPMVSTNNFAAAQSAGEHLMKLINNSGSIGILMHYKSSSTAIERKSGFMTAINSNKDVCAVDIPYDENGNISDVVEKFIKTHEDVDALFGSNLDMAEGIVKALEKLELKDIKVVVFDSSSQIAEALEQGYIDAIVLQKPFNMGYLSVKVVRNIIDEKSIEQFIDTGKILVTRENLDNNEVQKLIFPFLEQ